MQTKPPLFYYKTPIEEKWLQKEIEKTYSYENEIIIDKDLLQEVISSVVLFFQHLDLDIKHRLPKPEKIHYFYRKDYKDKFRTENISKHGLGFNKAFNKEIFLVFNRNSQHRNVKRLLHELVHIVSHTTLDLTPDKKVSYINYGFQNLENNSCRVLNEGFAEITTWDILKNHWHEFSLLCKYRSRSLDELSVSSPSSVELIDIILLKISKQSQLNYRELLGVFQKHLITDPANALRTLKAFLNPDVFNKIASLDYDQFQASTFDLAKSIFTKLGFVNGLKDYETKRKYVFMDRL